MGGETTAKNDRLREGGPSSTLAMRLERISLFIAAASSFSENDEQQSVFSRSDLGA